MVQHLSEGVTSLQTLHVYSTLKRRGIGRFHVISTWNTRGMFVGLLEGGTYFDMSVIRRGANYRAMLVLHCTESKNFH